MGDFIPVTSSVFFGLLSANSAMRLFSLFISVVAASNFLYAQNRELDSLEHILPGQKNADKVHTLIAIAWHYRQSNIEKAFAATREAIRLSSEAMDKRGIAASVARLGDLYEVTGRYDSALISFGEALALKTELADSAGIASTYNGMGMVHDQLGNDDKALENYFRALAMFEHLSDPLSQAMVLTNIGIVYKKQKAFEKTITYYRKALSIYEAESSPFGISVVNGNIGAVLLKLNRYEESINYSLTAYEGYKTLNYNRLMAYPLGNLGIAYDSLGQQHEAAEFFNQALALHRENENLIEVAFTLKNLANHELKWGDPSLAGKYALEAKQLAEEIKAADILQQSLVILTKCALHQDDFKKAFAFQQKYNELKDKAFEEEKTKIVFELEAKYESEKKDRALAAQRMALIEKDLELQKSRITQLGLGGTVLFLIVGGLLVRARLKLRFQKKLEAEKLIRQEELLRAVISSVEGERKRFSEDLHDSFGQLISILKMNVDSLSGNAASPVQRQRIFDQSVDVLNEMYGELKNVCFNLMPKTLIQHGLAKAIEELVAKVNHSGRLNASCAFFDLDERLEDIQEISMYRIVQEWTSNVLKYSDAQQLSIQITRDEQEITLTIEDDGMGFDDSLLKYGNGNGWKNLQSRTNLMKGVIELDTQPGRRGNMLTVNVPAVSSVFNAAVPQHI